MPFYVDLLWMKYQTVKAKADIQAISEASHQSLIGFWGCGRNGVSNIHPSFIISLVLIYKS